MPSTEQERAKESGAARAVPGWLPATLALGVLTTVALLWSSWREPEPSRQTGSLQTGSLQTGSLQTERLPLSPQECVTECQARQTDCIQACEGRVSCEKECVGVGEGCVARCRYAGDAGARPPATAPTPAPP